MSFVVRHVFVESRTDKRYYLDGGHAVWIRPERPPYVKCAACDYWDFPYKMDEHAAAMVQWELSGHGIPVVTRS
jgi:hypothetical protein